VQDDAKAMLIVVDDQFQKTFGSNACKVEPVAVSEEVEVPTSRQHDRADDDDGLGFG
jgi:hypothetical protein